MKKYIHEKLNKFQPEITVKSIREKLNFDDQKFDHHIMSCVCMS